MLLEKAFYRDPVNGSTVFEAFSKRVTHAVDRNSDVDSDNYAAEFVAINGLINAIVENLPRPHLRRARHLTIDTCLKQVSGRAPNSAVLRSVLIGNGHVPPHVEIRT